MAEMTEDAVIKRTSPHSAEAERSVIGAMILDDSVVVDVEEILAPSDFFDRRYGLLFEVIQELSDERKPVDEVTLIDLLREKNAPPEVSSPDFLADLIDSVPTSANAKYYATIVREKALLREIIRVTSKIENDCYLGNRSTEELLADTEKSVFDLVQNRGRSTIVSIREDVIAALKKIQETAKAGSYLTGVPSGFTKLDMKTAGFQPSDLILIAARPSMGKTAFVLNIAEYACFRQNKHCLIFSLEMSRLQLVNRLLAMTSHVSASDIRTGTLNDEDWKELIRSAGIIGKSNLAIDDTPAITAAEIRSRCMRHKVEHGLDMIIIDYLQMMSGSRNPKSEMSKQQEVAEISRSLKALARELNVPVIALSQLSRAPEQRPNHVPMLSDLRESGAIEQDADVVLFIYRDDYYTKEQSERPGIADIIIAKQRNGELGKVSLVWLAALTKFENMIEDDDQTPS